MRSIVDTVLARLGASDRLGLALMRVAIAVIFLWIGALKFVPYQADSITPFVANNPVMSLFYKHPDQYRAHLTREGQLVPAERAWQTENNTYGFSTGLGVVELTIGTLVLLDPVSVPLGFLGALLAFLTPFVTLSFLVTTPEAWVPALGDAEHGFPYLSGCRPPGAEGYGDPGGRPAHPGGLGPLAPAEARGGPFGEGRVGEGKRRDGGG
jgi:uncharacterized membrane protein YkgB